MNKINKGDTVYILEAFGYKERVKDEPTRPDVNEIGKYAKVVKRDGKGYEIKVIDGGGLYYAKPEHIEKISFYITDKDNKPVFHSDSLKDATAELDRLMTGDGYWFIWGSDDEPWQSGGLEDCREEAERNNGIESF